MQSWFRILARHTFCIVIFTIIIVIIVKCWQSFLPSFPSSTPDVSWATILPVSSVNSRCSSVEPLVAPLSPAVPRVSPVSSDELKSSPNDERWVVDRRRVASWPSCSATRASLPWLAGSGSVERSNSSRTLLQARPACNNVPYTFNYCLLDTLTYVYAECVSTEKWFDELIDRRRLGFCQRIAEPNAVAYIQAARWSGGCTRLSR